MTPEQVRLFVVGAAKVRRFRICKHARDQLDARSLAYQDLVSAMTTAQTARFEPDRGEEGRWLLEGGHAIDGEEVAVVVEIHDGVVVVTTW